MGTFHEKRDIKSTRKDHKCEGCCEKIKKGSSAEYNVGNWYEGFYYYYLCTPCSEFVKKYPKLVIDDLDDCFLSGEIPNIRKELEEKLKLEEN